MPAFTNKKIKNVIKFTYLLMYTHPLLVWSPK